MTDDSRVPSTQQIELEILEFLQQELAGPDVEVRRDDDLLAGELLDSIGVLRLVAFIEREFQIDMQSKGFVVENFQSVAVLADHVRRSAEQTTTEPADSDA